MSEVHMGKNIRAVRLLLGIKQEAFARLMGVSQQNISRLESMEKISAPKLAAVADVLGVPIGVIQNFSEKMALQISTDQQYEVVPPKAAIDYYKAEIAKRDQMIIQLQAELEKIRALGVAMG